MDQLNENVQNTSLDDDELDEEVDNYKDEDTCSVDELEKLFPNIYIQMKNIKISSNNSYCINLDNDSKFDNIAVSTSENDIHIIKYDSFSCLTK